MSVQQLAQNPVPEALPDDLESAQSKLVYLYLQVSGGATIQELQETLGLQKLSLYPVLRRLVEENVVDRTGNVYVCTSA